MQLIEKHLDSLTQLCNTYNVDKMYLFGSAVNSTFDAKSDIDFLVKFKAIDLAKYFDNYMDFKKKLQNLFNRDVDLVEEQALKNPILKKSIDRSKKLVYG